MSTILIAYEREMEQNALQKLLVERGHTILKANNGVDALETARREDPQLIVSDISLPKMDGFALLKKWKQDDRLQRVPFIFYTRRHDDPKYERFALELGTDRYLERSNDPSQLYRAVDEMLAEGAVARKVDTQRLQALSTGSFTATARMAAHPVVEEPRKANGSDGAAVAAASEPAPMPPATASASSSAETTLAGTAEDRFLQREARLLARIAERDALNKQLQTSELRFRQLFDASPTPMWLLNSDDKQCTAVNAAALTLYGYTRDEFLNLPRTQPPFAPGAPIANPAAGSHATWHRTKSGSAIAVELSMRPVELGMRRAEIYAAHDVTQRVFAQQATAHAGDAYQALLVASADGMWLLDAEQRLIDVNEAYCRMSGYQRDELLKLAPRDLEMVMDAESTIRLHQCQAGEQRGDGNTYESTHRRKDGSLYPVEVSVGSLTGVRTRSVVVIRDITVRSEQQQAAQLLARAHTAALDLVGLAPTQDEAGLIRRALELAAGVSQSPLTYFVGVDAESTQPQLAAVYEQSRGLAVSVPTESRKLAAQSPSQQCIKTKKPLTSNDARRGEVSSALPAQQPLLLMPVIGDNECLGALAIANRSTAYTEADQRVLAPIAATLASILQIKRTQALTLMTARRADVALQGIIEGLSRVVERHDQYTVGGPTRVAALAVAIARELKVPAARQNALRTAALLHGVGNIAIPSSLLNKPNVLSTAELALVRTHVDEGRKILSEIEFGSPVSEIVYQHHERLDGSGYPRGLRGDDIMLEARILAVADVVEAMCASRPHRPALGIDAALTEIEKGADRLFDAKVVAVCVRLFREQGFKFPD